MSNYNERSVEGKHVVITGATNGIGREIARGLVRRGARLTVLARSEAKAIDTVEELAREDGAMGTPRYVIGDLADLVSVRRAVLEIAERGDDIDLLVNNAGIHTFAGSPSADGYELMMATNHLGPFLFTNLLLDLVSAAAPSRIVVTASEAHRTRPRVDLNRMAEHRDYGLVGAEFLYGQSKLMNILFTQELARRLAGTGVTVNCFCPGPVSTGLVRESRVLTAAARMAARSPIIRRPEVGAKMGLRLALDADLDSTTGQFFTSTPGLRFLPDVRIRKDNDFQRQAWQRSADLVGMSSFG